MSSELFKLHLFLGFSLVNLDNFSNIASNTPHLTTHDLISLDSELLNNVFNIS